MSNCIIIQSGYQIDPQHKAAAAISVAFAQDAKDFQMSDDVFNYHALACQPPVKSFLLGGQLAAFRLLERYPRVFVQSRQSLITAVAQTLDRFRQFRFAVFVKREIVSCPLTKARVRDAARSLTNPHLSFYRVPLLPARIIPFLFFFDGLSIGDSATSTTTTSISSGKSAALLPGKANSLESVKISSTRATMRETADPEMPQLVPEWNIVRYSRRYSSVNNTWSSIVNFGGLPLISRWAALLR